MRNLTYNTLPEHSLPCITYDSQNTSCFAKNVSYDSLAKSHRYIFQNGGAISHCGHPLGIENVNFSGGLTCIAGTTFTIAA